MTTRACCMLCGAMVIFASGYSAPAMSGDNITRVYVRNNCGEVLDVDVRYVPVGGSKFVGKHYVFSPGEVGYLVDTSNLYITIAAKSRDSSRQLAKRQVNVGERAGKYTHTLTC